MFSWRSLPVLAALAATLTACCCPFAGLLDEAEFTTGDFADVPAYPAATQTTDSSTALNAMIAALSLVVEEGEWKHYVTDDSGSTVLDWYGAELMDYGWAEAELEDVGVEGGLFFFKVAEPDTALYLFALPDPEGGSETHIIIGRVQLPIEFEE